jgi:hypothetical protein
LPQFARFEDNFVNEDLQLNIQDANMEQAFDDGATLVKKGVRRINRRDAARAVAQALVSPDLKAKKVQIWTDELNKITTGS